MGTADVSLGYVILYVDDVAGTLAFYEEAFGLRRRFFNDDNGMAYGELETGATRLAFASFKLANSHLPEQAIAAATGNNARVYGLNSGVIAAGRDADIAILDIDAGNLAADLGLGGIGRLVEAQDQGSPGIHCRTSWKRLTWK